MRIPEGSETGDSPFGAIFWHAYRRIWAGRLMVVAETVFWSIAAAYVGFWVFDLTTFRVDSLLF